MVKNRKLPEGLFGFTELKGITVINNNPLNPVYPVHPLPILFWVDEDVNPPIFLSA